MRAHPQQQRFEGLAGAEQPDVGRGRGRQQAAQRVERLGADHRAVHGVGIVRRLADTSRGSALPSPGSSARRSRTRGRASRRNASRSGEPVELRRHVIFPAAVRPIGVRHVARRLLEVGHQASPLEHLGQDVGDAFAGDVRAAELRDRVVAVLVEHARVELVGALGADAGARTAPPAWRGGRSRRGTRRGTAGAAISPIASSARTARPSPFRADCVSAKTGRSVLVKYGASARDFVGREGLGGGGREGHGGRVFYRACRSTVAYRHRLDREVPRLRRDGARQPCRVFHVFRAGRLTFWRELTGAPSPHTRVIIARAECDYRAPAHFGDELEVRARRRRDRRDPVSRCMYEIVQLAGDGVGRHRQDRDGQLRLREAKGDAASCPGTRSLEAPPGSDPGLTLIFQSLTDCLRHADRGCTNLFVSRPARFYVCTQCVEHRMRGQPSAAVTRGVRSIARPPVCSGRTTIPALTGFCSMYLRHVSQ